MGNNLVKSNYDFVIKRYEKYSKIIHQKSIKYNVDKFKVQWKIGILWNAKIVLDPTNIENVKKILHNLKA
jgi:hypothetical protein